MEKEIVVAIIGAAGALGAALIGLLKKDAASNMKEHKIEQKVTGNYNTIIGTQVNNNNHSEQIAKVQDSIDDLREEIGNSKKIKMEFPNESGATRISARSPLALHWATGCGTSWKSSFRFTIILPKFKTTFFNWHVIARPTAVAISRYMWQFGRYYQEIATSPLWGSSQ